jgi:chaperonin cofactor prefoldin
MMLEDLYKQTEKLVERVDAMMHNQVNIERLEKDMGKAQNDIEKLKDNLRTFSNGAH